MTNETRIKGRYFDLVIWQDVDEFGVFVMGRGKTPGIDTPENCITGSPENAASLLHEGVDSWAWYEGQGDI